MKILFVAPWIPASVRPRSLVILEMLAAEHDVRFLGLMHDEEEARLAELLPVKERTLVAQPTRRFHAALRTCASNTLNEGVHTTRPIAIRKSHASASSSPTPNV